MTQTAKYNTAIHMHYYYSQEQENEAYSHIKEFHHNQNRRATNVDIIRARYRCLSGCNWGLQLSRNYAQFGLCYAGCNRQFPDPPPTTAATTATSTTQATATMPTVTTAATSTTQATATAVNDPESTAVNDPEINDPESTHDPIIPIGQSAGQQAQQLLPQAGVPVVSNFALPIIANVWFSIILLTISFAYNFL